MHTSIIVPLLLHPSEVDETAVEQRLEELDPEALIREARRRQRRRRLVVAALALVLAGSGVTLWRLAFDNGAAVGQRGQPSPSAVAPQTLTLHLRGWGTVVQGYSGLHGGGCTDGVTSVPIVTSTGQRVGSLSECDLVVSKSDRSNGDVLSTHANMLGTYKLPGGTIDTHEQRIFRFARDQTHTFAHFSGRITGGSGRYARVRGTISGGGPGNTGGPGESDTAHWRVVFHFR